MNPPNLHSFADWVLFEDNHLLIVNKPAPLATMGALGGHPSLVQAAKDYLKIKYRKPGNVYLGVVSRLDLMVTGAVVLARTSKAAARLSSLFAAEQVQKIYWAVVQPPPSPARQECVDWLIKDERRRRMVRAEAEQAGAKRARLSYRTLASHQQAALLQVQLFSGRKHQIRAQFSERGWPIWGDRKYGAATRFPLGIALHAKRLEFLHPVGNQPLRVAAPLPAYWPAWTREKA